MFGRKPPQDEQLQLKHVAVLIETANLHKCWALIIVTLTVMYPPF